jgi:hypothetical protein
VGLLLQYMAYYRAVELLLSNIATYILPINWLRRVEILQFFG